MTATVASTVTDCVAMLATVHRMEPVIVVLMVAEENTVKILAALDYTTQTAQVMVLVSNQHRM